jgi:hypothetical protein
MWLTSKMPTAGAHRHVLVDNTAANRRGIFHRHVPAIEVDHLRAHLAMDGVQRGLADGGSGGRRLHGRQSETSISEQRLDCWMV